MMATSEHEVAIMHLQTAGKRSSSSGGSEAAGPSLPRIVRNLPEKHAILFEMNVEVIIISDRDHTPLRHTTRT